MKSTQNKIIIFSAPSGSGKTTIVRALLEKKALNLEFSVSACSRRMRPGEVDGKDYYFFTPEEFQNKIQNKEFLEWEEVYSGQYYGTLKSEVERIWAKGNHILFDIDVVGGLNIKKMYPQEALAVFVMAPSIEELAKRLKNRGTETEESLNRRISKAQQEIELASQFDYILVNDNLEKAINEAGSLVEAFVQN